MHAIIGRMPLGNYQNPSTSSIPTMAAVARMPFTPLDGARLQALTSLKNRQNVMADAPAKRKASEFTDMDGYENLDPSVFSKRSKSANAFDSLLKPFTLLVTKHASTPAVSKTASSSKATRPRLLLQPKSPAARIRINTDTTVSASLTVPAVRSPTRGSRRFGILNRRRHFDPHSFALATAPFSLDAALEGSIPTYQSRSKPLPKLDLDTSSSWHFVIHEDTPEQEMTNLLQHGTCTLDISSDEESEQREQRELAEGRDKENIPPPGDESQTTLCRAARRAAWDEMVVDKTRNPLREMGVEEFYRACDSASHVVIVPVDEDDVAVVSVHCSSAATSQSGSAEKALTEVMRPTNPVESVAVLLGADKMSTKAAVLEPIDGSGDGFEVWASSSSKDEADVLGSPGCV